MATATRRTVSEEEEFKRVSFTYGLVMVRTKRFGNLMDRLGNRRISKPVGWFLLYLLPVGCAIALFLFLTSAGVLFSPGGSAVASYVRTLNPLGNLGLPGINPYIPWVYGWIALFVAIIIHEGAHGVVARSLNLPVKASGLIFFLVVPLGAFVEVDESALKTARARDSERVLAAGAGVNLVLGILCLFLLVGLVSTAVPAANGLGVQGVVLQVQQHGSFVPTPAALAGIKPGDFITAVNGAPINDTQAFENSAWYKPGNVINITIWRGGDVIQLNGVRLTNRTFEDTQTHVNTTVAFLGVNQISLGDLKSTASAYSSSLFSSPRLYICIPTLPICQTRVPFSDSLSIFYTSPAGALWGPLANLLYWLFFLNFNLSIFNALPIYPLDGGQAFQVGVKAIGGGRLSEKGLMRITILATLSIVFLLALVVVGPYLL
jgi:membrane-associated protease RseP (regulator of RpoE activity)